MSDAFSEALKAMGRMDGDMIDSAGEARTIEGWRQECERLRGRVTQLEGERDGLKRERQGWIDRCKANDATYDALNREHTKLKAECERLKGQLAQADRNCEELQAEREAAKSECERLKADQRGDVMAGENEALRIIVRHLAKLL
jgi:chromosome segregation ATPase